MAVDGEVLERIRERLRVSTRVGDERIDVATRDDDVVLLATVAGQLAEEYATSVVNELEVDRGLREGSRSRGTPSPPPRPATRC
jgi:hypothetical protein